MDFTKFKPSEHLQIYTELSEWRINGTLPDDSLFRKTVKEQTGDDNMQMLLIGQLDFYKTVFDEYGHEKLSYEASAELSERFL